MMSSIGYHRGLLLSVLFATLCLQVTHLQNPFFSEGEEVPLDAEVETWNSDDFNEEAAQTYNLVFHKYNNRIRPPDLFVKVDAAVTLTHVRHLDVRKQELQTVLDLELSWVDTRLQWRPDKVLEMHETADRVWCPDLVYTNGVAPIQQLYPKVVRIIHNGSVSWLRKEIVTTRCETQPSSIEQNCVIKIGFVLNGLKGNEQNSYFFSGDSTASMATAENGLFSHKWHLRKLELNMGDENETKSTSIDLDLSFEHIQRETHTATGSSPGSSDSPVYTTDYTNTHTIENGETASASGRRDPEDCCCSGCGAAPGSIHIRSVPVLVLSWILGTFAVAFLTNGAGLADR